MEARLETEGLTQTEKDVYLNSTEPKNLIDFLRQANGRKEIYRQRTIGTQQKLVKYVESGFGEVRTKPLSAKKQEGTLKERMEDITTDIYAIDEEVKTTKADTEWGSNRARSKTSRKNRQRHRGRQTILPENIDTYERNEIPWKPYDRANNPKITMLTKKGIKQVNKIITERNEKLDRKVDELLIEDGEYAVSNLYDDGDRHPNLINVDIDGDMMEEYDDKELFTSIEVVNQDEPISNVVDESLETIIEYAPDESFKIKLNADNWEENGCYVYLQEQPYSVIPEEQYSEQIGLSIGDNKDITDKKIRELFIKINYGDRLDENINYDSSEDNLYYINPFNIGWSVNQALLTIPIIKVNYNSDDKNYRFYFVGFIYPNRDIDYKYFFHRDKFIQEQFSNGFTNENRTQLKDLPFKNQNRGSYDNNKNEINYNYPNIIEQANIEGTPTILKEKLAECVNKLLQYINYRVAEKYGDMPKQYHIKYSESRDIVRLTKKKD
jgi:hypothetical protein